MTDARAALVDRLRRYHRLVEVGVGRRPGVAERLVELGCDVTATDVVSRPTPPGVTFVRDDVTDPDREVYAAADAVYARNLPPDLHRPTRAVARESGADFLFTTLGADQPAIPVAREMLAGGETLYRATSRGTGSKRE